MPTLYLVDGSSYLYRAFHAMPNLSTRHGEPTGAVYGVANMLRRLLHEKSPDYVAVVFDAPGKTFRHELYPDYKATRPPMPEALAGQIPLIHQIVEAMGLPMLIESGVEADDVLGTLATQADSQGWNVEIFTGDKDLAQLVKPRIQLYDSMKESQLDEAGVAAKFGVPPSAIVDYLALMGDSVDNVPGVEKVGPKTAAKWLQEYGSLDNIKKNAENIKGKAGENLRAALDKLELSRQLVTIRCDVELALKPDDLQIRPADEAKLQEIYQRLEFKSWLKPPSPQPLSQGERGFLPPLPPGEGPGVRANYETLLTWEAFAVWLEKLKKAALFSFDTETTSLDYMNARLVGLSFSVESGCAAYVPLAHDYLDAPKQLPLEQVLNHLKPLLEDEKLKKVGQNIKYDAHILENYGIHIQGVAYDTLLESYVLEATERHNMDALALRHLGIETVHYEHIAGKGIKQLTFNQIALEQAAPYAAEDAEVTLRLHQCLWPQLAAQPGLKKVFETLEMPLLPILQKMERRGVKIDAARLYEQSGELAVRLRELESQAHQAAGQPFNLGSPKQLQAILFEQLGLPVLSKTPTGQPSTAEDVLAELALDYELPRLIMEHRSLAKLKSTYTDKLPGQINKKTGRVHTSYHQAVAQTGRLSSSDPNLQNIPVRTEEGRRIRQAFIAPPGYKLLSADYSQIELRIMAHLSEDDGLLRAFAAGEDIHQATAAEVFGLKPEQVTKEQRRAAKAINFGLIYGMSAFGLARQLGISRGVAQDYVDQYFNRYPGVRRYMENTRKQAAEQGYVETVFGRRLSLPDIAARQANRRAAAERAAINAPMQGTAADIIKLAMIRVEKQLQDSSLAASMIMQVHDELVFEIAEDQIGPARELILREMRNAAQLSVPLGVEAGVGENWDEAH